VSTFVSTFEGLAVGRDKFVKDAGEVMDLLLRTQVGENGMAEDDPQLSFMISAWARICKILGPDFEPYLPMVMGPVMKTAGMKPEVTVVDQDDMEAVNGATDNDDWQFVSLGDQQNFGIKTSGKCSYPFFFLGMCAHRLQMRIFICFPFGTVRSSNFDLYDPKMGVFLQCGHPLK
jgi:hypothetical protein